MTQLTIASDSCLGRIQSIKLPEGWVEAPRPAEIGGRILRKFHPPGHTEIRFCMYFRGVEISHPAAQAFQKTLYSEFHALSQEEIRSLDDVFEGMSNEEAFRFDSAMTNYLNGRKTIQVEGKWLRENEDTAGLFLDANGDGKIVHQIYFTAPSNLFKQFLTLANSAFVSIEWLRSS